MNVDKLPKIELHLHLDCSLSFDVVKKLNPAITFEAYKDDFKAPANCNNLLDYIRCADAGIALMQTKEQLELVTLDLFEQLKRDNVIYAEIRFAPLQHITQLNAKEVVETVNAACEKGIHQTGIECGIILCTLRHYTEEQSMETVKLVEAFKGTHIVGFDIAADEMQPVKAHEKAFTYAHEKNIPCTAHCGEARGAESVWETLKGLNPSRIGHGVRSIEDEKLITYLKEKDIHLEICPSSNVQTGIYKDLKKHRVNEIYNLGLNMGINTDGRTISDVTLSEEYAALSRIFDWETEHFLKCNLFALNAAFTDEETRSRLKEKLLKDFGVL